MWNYLILIGDILLFSTFSRSLYQVFAVDHPIFVDVSEQLLSAVPFISSDIEQMDSSVTAITIPNNSCNDSNYSNLGFSRFASLESLEIGNECYKLTKSFRIEVLRG